MYQAVIIRFDITFGNSPSSDLMLVCILLEIYLWLILEDIMFHPIIAVWSFIVILNDLSKVFGNFLHPFSTRLKPLLAAIKSIFNSILSGHQILYSGAFVLFNMQIFFSQVDKMRSYQMVTE